jgi:hypothetical protein
MEKTPNNVPISELLDSLRDPETPHKLSAETKETLTDIAHLASGAFRKHPTTSTLVAGILLGAGIVAFLNSGRK